MLRARRARRCSGRGPRSWVVASVEIVRVAREAVGSPWTVRTAILEALADDLALGGIHARRWLADVVHREPYRGEGRPSSLLWLSASPRLQLPADVGRHRRGRRPGQGRGR